MAIVDVHGKPIDRAVLKEPQTARVAALQNEYLTSHLDGLTPARLVRTLRAADNGDLVQQHRLFADMEERNVHLQAEMNKRKLALLGLDWSIVPPRNATAAEKAHAEWLTEVLTDAVDPIEDLILSLMDGVGHGFSAVELEWRNEGGELLPSFHPRPQEWFRLDSQRREIRLRDSSVDGAPLAAFGWCFHTHGKAKTGYAARLGLYRTLLWPFLYSTYALGDFAEFLEIYGLPMIVGKYYSGAAPEEKSSLLRAVTSLGHDARAIMPAEMEIEIKECSSSGSRSVHLEMVDWSERSISKSILGQTMSAEAKASGLGSGNASLHREVRHDILEADARQIGGTITRDLLYPLIALNRGNIDGLRRCPRLVFDCSEPEDIKAFADAVPKLVGVGMRIKTEWLHEKLGVPLAGEKDETLAVATPANVLNPELRPEPGKKTPVDKAAALAALSAERAAAQRDAFDDLADQMSDEWESSVSPLVSPIERLADECTSLEEFQRRLPEAIAQMDVTAVADLISRGLFAAYIDGRAIPGKAK